MKKYLFAVIATIAPMTAFAESTYLNCKLASASPFNIGTAYKIPPKNLRNQFFNDAIEKGIIGYFTPPPTTWEVNFSEKTVTSPEENNKIFKISTLTNSKLEGSYFDFSLSINRIDSNLKYFVNIKEEVVSEWEKTHGGKLPLLLTYEYKCTSSSKPNI